YADSILDLFAALDIKLEEVPDWNCCGATAAHSIHHQASIDLAVRNLRLASTLTNPDMLVPCALCYNRLKTAAKELQSGRGRHDPGEFASGIPKIWDLANYFADENNLGTIEARVRRPLEGLRVVCYYGCMASRPPFITDAKEYENPQSMDRIVGVLGATPILWPFKTDCCGASLSLSRPDIVYQMVTRLYEMAERLGAQAIVVSCQMCQANLDMCQEKLEALGGRRFAIPIIYFTELIGWALELKNVSSILSRHFVDPRPLLEGGWGAGAGKAKQGAAQQAVRI
ncbi:MAG: heterodisulfide reductase-related iron-sulfur binding cluster, partial [Desulforhabdus sp.]|nr:heterodisulfide reductase-related iron-sulfur binding cluster [Desulforhabdus sp.]